LDDSRQSYYNNYLAYFFGPPCSLHLMWLNVLGYERFERRGIALPTNFGL